MKRIRIWEKSIKNISFSNKIFNLIIRYLNRFLHWVKTRLIRKQFSTKFHDQTRKYSHKFSFELKNFASNVYHFLSSKRNFLKSFIMNLIDIKLCFYLHRHARVFENKFLWIGKWNILKTNDSLIML